MLFVSCLIEELYDLFNILLLIINYSYIHINTRSGTMCKVEPEFYDWMKDYLVDEEGVEITILDFYGYAIGIIILYYNIK